MYSPISLGKSSLDSCNFISCPPSVIHFPRNEGFASSCFTVDPSRLHAVLCNTGEIVEGCSTKSSRGNVTMIFPLAEKVCRDLYGIHQNLLHSDSISIVKRVLLAKDFASRSHGMDFSME